MNTTTQTEPKLETGFIGCGFWARYGGQYAGGYRSERQAINAARRKFAKYVSKFPNWKV